MGRNQLTVWYVGENDGTVTPMSLRASGENLCRYDGGGMQDVMMQS